LRSYSASSLTTAAACLRKFGFKYIAGLEEPSGPAAAFGTEFHARRDRYLRGEEVPDLEREGLEYLPAPNTPGLEIEREFGIVIRGVWFTGRKDFELPGIVGDHKTGTEFRYTPGKLKKDWQANLYAAESMHRAGGAPAVELHWICYRRACPPDCGRRHVEHYTEPAAKPVVVTVTRADVAPVIEEMHELASILAVLEDAGAEPLDLPPSPAACDDFGGCPYIDLCPTVERLFPMAQTPEEVLAAIRARKGVNPPAPPPAPTLVLTPGNGGAPGTPPPPKAPEWQASMTSSTCWKNVPMKMISSFCTSPVPAHRMVSGTKATTGM